MNKFCQSCGMPMKKDPQEGGTNSDGTKNADYCSFCYQKGAFTQPNLTAKQMQDFCIEKMREIGMPKFIGWLFTRNIPKFKRWKK
ncbi:MAG: zinc ribbon domain-containing protein [Elusimicrobiota bacterium]